MKKLSEEANQIAIEVRMFADNIGDHNPGLRKHKVPIETLQYDAACLARAFAGIYGKLGEKAKDG